MFKDLCKHAEGLNVEDVVRKMFVKKMGAYGGIFNQVQVVSPDFSKGYALSDWINFKMEYIKLDAVLYF